MSNSTFGPSGPSNRGLEREQIRFWLSVDCPGRLGSRGSLGRPSLGMTLRISESRDGERSCLKLISRKRLTVHLYSDPECRVRIPNIANFLLFSLLTGNLARGFDHFRL